MKKGARKRFCLRGHDTLICGRYKGGACKECRKIRGQIEYAEHAEEIKQIRKQHYKDNAERIKKSKRLSYQTNKEKAKEYQKEHEKEIKEYRQTHKVEIRTRMKKWRNENKGRIKKQAKIYYDEHKSEIISKIVARHNKRRKVDMQFKLSQNLRVRIQQAIKTNQKVGSAVKDLGCTIDFLISYLQEQFYGKMTWDNYGTYWQIDHVVPLWKFDLTNRKQFLKACHYTNLQPLTISDHKKKTAKEVKEFYDSLATHK